MLNFKSIERFYQKYSNYITILLLVVLCLWRIPFISKGVDYTDTGYSMSNYANVFSGEGINGIGVFFTTLIGGIIYNFLPAYHLLVLRTLHWILGLISYYFAYKLFKKYLDKNLILVLLFGISLFSKSGEALYGYYSMTKCLLMISIYMLHRGLVCKKNLCLLISGFIAGLNIAFRLPNILYLSVFLCIVWYGINNKEEYKNILKNVILYFAGALIALIFILIVMVLTMGVEKVLNSFMSYVYLATGQTIPMENILGIEEKSGHSIFAEIKIMGYQGIITIIDILCFYVPIALVMLALYYVIKKSNSKSKAFFYTLMFLALLIYSYIMKGFVADTITRFLGLFSMLVSTITMFGLRKNNIEYSLLFSLTVLTGFSSIWGSDLGLLRLSTIDPIILLSLFLGIYVLVSDKLDCEFYLKPFSNKIIVKNIYVTLYILLIINIYISGLFVYVPKTYCDAHYSELNYTLNSDIKILKGMKTSKRRADEINEYYNLMNAEELKGREVAIFGYFPLGFVISKHKNYFESIQPCIDYPSVSVERMLRVIKEKDNHNIKPVIVVSYVNQLQRNDDHFTSEAKMAVLDYMLHNYNYEIYSDSEYFTIYKPN